MTQTTDDSVFGKVLAPNAAYLDKALAEPVLEPELAIIDAHMHLWDLFDGAPYFLPEFADEIARGGHNVVGSVFIECHAMRRQDGPEHLRSVGETEFAVGQAAMARSGKYTLAQAAQGIVGFVDLRLGDRVEEALQAHIEAANGRFRGIRQRAKWDADPVVKGKWSEDQPQLYLDAGFGEGLRKLTALGLSFDASIYHPQLPDVVELARRFPDTRIILNHSGSPVGHGSYAGREAENHALWMAGMKDLAACPNAYVKLGGVLMNLANFDASKAARPPSSAELADLWRPYIEPCIELFGVERCMVSSNFPVDKFGFGYRTVWNMFKRITAGCSDEEKASLYHGTARQAYRLAGGSA